MWVAGNDANAVSGNTDEWGKLWGNQAASYSSWDKGGVKTMHDPCPVGYRVPSVGHFRFITAHGDNAGAGYNYDRNWKYNVNTNIFTDDVLEGETKNTPLLNNHGKGNAPYGFFFYVKGSKTAAQASDYKGQDNGNLPADQTTAYFPAQGLINWGHTYYTQGDYAQVAAHTNAVSGTTTFFMKAMPTGEFYNNTTRISYGEQQAKALPVRCVRE